MIGQTIITTLLVIGSVIYIFLKSRQKIANPCSDCSSCPAAGSCQILLNKKDINIHDQLAAEPEEK